MAKEPLGDRFFRGLLRILPFDFRSEFGDEMEEAFREHRAASERRNGSAGVCRMWWATIADIVRMAPREHAAVLKQDTRYALRMMRKNRGFTLAAIVILGLGIGVNTSIFSVVNSVLLRDLPYAQGDQLLILRQSGAKAGAGNIPWSVSDLRDYRERNRTLSDLVEYHSMTFTLLGGSEPHQVRTGVVSNGFFRYLGISPILGRSFTPEEEQPGAQPVLLLSYEFWKAQEHGDPNIIGKKYEMNDRTHIVIGVLPAIPQYPNENDVYMTTTSCPFRSRPAFIANRTGRMMRAFARMKPGVTLAQVRSDLNTIARDLQKQYPDAYPESIGYATEPLVLREELTHTARPLLWALLGAAAFVLLIACANVANLILARMARRERELVIRTAMGAGAGRLLRQLLTESLILAILAAGVGLAFAWASMELLTRFAAQLTPRAREISIDGWVLAFAIACAAATTVVCGTLAALHARTDVASGLKQNAGHGAPARGLLRSVLIAAQVAFSYMLLIGAGLMVNSLVRLQHVDPGFSDQHAFAISYDLNFSRYPNSAALRTATRRLLDRTRDIPGVVYRAVASSFPMDPNGPGSGIPVALRTVGDNRPDGELPTVNVGRSVSPDYFQALGVPLLAGRFFRDSDNGDAQPVVLVNRALARSAWPNSNPVGRTFSFVNPHFIGVILPKSVQVVGVVGDIKEFGPQQESPPVMYLPMEQSPNPVSIVVRTAGDTASTITAVRRAVLEANPEAAVVRVETLEEARADAVAQPRTTARLFGLFGLLALVIAVAGIGGMLALWVRQRMHEIGIRIALGASPGDILTAVVRQGMLLAMVGAAAGLAGSLMFARAIAKLLFEVTPTDPPTYVVVSVLLLGAALAACWIPARRAARIDPQLALRTE
jgi:putative ABC transport system permease protein